MEKEDYKEALELLNKNIEDLNNQKKQLKQAFIDENAEFKVGEKVLVIDSTKTENAAFIKSVSISYNGEIEYKFLKCKKDGTPSQHELWSWRFVEIKPFN